MANSKKMDSCLEQCKFYLSVLSISYIFAFIVYGEKQTFICKELGSP